MFNSSRLAAFAFVVSLALSGCSGGGGSSSSGALPPSNPPSVLTPTPGPALATVPVQVKAIYAAPGSPAPQSKGRHPLFVSPSTNSAKLVIYPHGSGTAQATYVYDLSVGSGLCTGSAPRTCTFNINAPVGNLDFVLDNYDLAPVAGAIPGPAQHLGTTILTQNIVANTPNTVTFALSGIPTVVALSTGAGPLTYTSEAADGSTHTLAITASVKDVDGNVIGGTASYSTPVSVSLAEAGGSGHSVLVINGTPSGVAGTLTSPTTTLAVQYDGLGAVGYTTVLNVGASSATLSPLYVTPSTVVSHAVNGSPTVALSETNAPGAIAYSATYVCPEVTGTSTVGSGASATTTINTTAPAGTTDAGCTVTLKDVLGTQVTVPLNIAVYGPSTFSGAPALSAGVTRTCGTSLAFTNPAQTATITISDPGFAGPYVLSVPSPAVATATSLGSTVTITSVAAGSETIGISDGFGNSLNCPVGVTTTSGSVS